MQLRRGLMQLRHSVTASHRCPESVDTFPCDFLNFSWRFPLLFHVISSVFLRNFLNFSWRFSVPPHAISSAKVHKKSPDLHSMSFVLFPSVNEICSCA